MSVHELFERDRVIFDGAMGANLLPFLKDGPPWAAEPVHLNLWLSVPVMRLHMDYARAGADILTTNTLTGNRLMQRYFDKGDEAAHMSLVGANIAKSVVGEWNSDYTEDGIYLGKSKHSRYVAGSVGDVAPPVREAYSRYQIEQSYFEQCIALCHGGSDILLLESFIDQTTLDIALVAARRVKEEFPETLIFVTWPVIDESLDSVARLERILRICPVDAAGINCTSPDVCVQHIKDLSEYMPSMPLIARPNPGAPPVESTEDPLSPFQFGLLAEELVDAGAKFVGGCCGTTPEYIRAVVQPCPLCTTRDEIGR